MTKEESIEATKHPGKFEGCAEYVPYYWDKVLNGESDDYDWDYDWDYDDGRDIDIFNITKEDMELWPELIGYKELNLWQDDNGFVYCEVI